MFFACWTHMKVLLQTELFVNILLGAQDMFRQSSAAPPKMSDVPILPYIKNQAKMSTKTRIFPII